MRVQCYADGTYSARRRRKSGWGVVILAPDGRYELAGRGPYNVSDSNQVELAAITAAVAHTLEMFPGQVTVIEVVTHSQGALHLLNLIEPHPTLPAIRRMQRILWRSLSQNCVSLESRWVRGHRRGKSQDAALNRRADSLAAEGKRSRVPSRFPQAAFVRPLPSLGGRKYEVMAPQRGKSR